MKAAATVPIGGIAPARHEPQPVVLINGALEPRLIVKETVMTGLTDERQARLAVASTDPAAFGGPTRRRWLNADASIALPLRLVDESVRYPVLLNGLLRVVSTDRATDRNEQSFEVTDRWSTILDRQLHTSWWQTSGGVIFDEARPAVIRVGSRANRSAVRWPVGGQQVFVFQEDGQAWRVGDALEALSAMADLELITSLLPEDIRDAPVIDEIDLGESIRVSLSRLLERYGLTIQRDLYQQGAHLVEQRAVRPMEHGRRVRLAWPREGEPSGHVLRIDTDRPSPRTKPWVARADGWMVESTFELVQAWDPALDGESDATYARSTSPDFPTYANVFRLWALNEDGAFSVPPYNQGASHDLAGLFGQGTVRPRPLRFLAPLTLDDTGTRRSPIVETSTDGGQNWSLYAGPTKISTDRAAVYLDDATLPAAFLSAAKSGQARVRVTASLQAPRPVEIKRWQGNPFGPIGESIILDAGGAFQFARVDGQSIHAADVASGVLVAREQDQTENLRRWLVHQMQRAEATDRSSQGRGVLRLAGVWPLLRVGDRLFNVAGPGVDPAGRHETVDGQGANVAAVRCNWGGDSAPPAAPLTEVTLTF